MNTDTPKPEPGDVVKLKSGGPKMTVQSATKAKATCVWFDGHRNNTGDFPISCLIFRKRTPTATEEGQG